MFRRMIRFRKQHDWCKIALLSLLTGTIFLIIAVIWFIKFINYMAEPIEFELTSGEVVSSSDMDFSKLSTQKNVCAISEEIDQTITFIVHENKIPLLCHWVSDDYMEKVYGLLNDNSMIVLYANEKAFDELGQAVKDGNYIHEDMVQNAGLKEIQIKMLEGEDGSKEEKIVKVILLNQIENEEPCLFGSIDSYYLRKKRTDVRVYYGSKDYNREYEKSISEAGYSFVKPEQVRLEAYDRQILLMKIRNLFIIGIILIGTAWAVSFERKEFS